MVIKTYQSQLWGEYIYFKQKSYKMHVMQVTQFTIIKKGISSNVYKCVYWSYYRKVK